MRIDLIYPEIVILSLALLILLISFLRPKRPNYLGYLSLIGLIGAFLTCGKILGEESFLFEGMFRIDAMSSWVKMLFLVLSLLVTLASIDFYLTHPEEGGYYALLLFSLGGAMIMASSTDLITLFLGLELSTLPCFILVSLRKKAKSIEGALKYFFLALIATALFVYGISIFYGLIGSSNFLVISNALKTRIIYLPLVLATILVTVGFSFKMALVPFHFWAPDAYEGAPTLVAAFLAVIPKCGILIAMVRFFSLTLSQIRLDWLILFVTLSFFTMTFGNIMALTQDNVKRMLAYSSVAHSGYLLVGLAVGTKLAIEGMLLYLMVYTIANLGAFSVIFACTKEEKEGLLSDFSGMGERAPLLSFAMTLFLLSLVGIPPLAGFMGKIHLFGAAVEAGFAWLAVVGVLNSVISLGYYLKVVKEMYFVAASERGIIKISPLLAVALGIEVLAVLLIGIYPAPFIELAQFSAGILPKGFF